MPASVEAIWFESMSICAEQGPAMAEPAISKHPAPAPSAIKVSFIWLSNICA